MGANGEEPLHIFEPSIRARGSGTRYDVHTYLWVDDRVEVKWRQRERLVPRLDNTSDPLTCGAIEIRARDIARVWFGLRYNESRLEWWSQRGLRSHYVRQNLGSGEIAVWRWYRCGEFRKWWQRQTKLRALGVGRQRRLGRWKRVRLHPPAPSQFPNWDGSEPPDE